jgi:epoxide hydrolase-like predicted phosphatase
MLKGVILDYGGVFTDTRPRQAVLRRCEEALGLAGGELTRLLFASEHWRAVSTGRISADAYWQRVREHVGKPLPDLLVPFKHNPFAYETLNGRMVKLARRLHTCYATALLSNATLLLEELLSENGLTGLFDVIVNSARVGLRKPDPEIFALTLRKMELAPKACLFVDDKERNTEVAKALGMQVVVFRSAAHLTRRLNEIESQASMP